MKSFFYSLTLLLLLAGSALAQNLTVHEWGTFTTLRGSTGGTLSGLYFEEEQLPSFVYHHPGFSPDPSISTNGYRPVANCNVKMETPVLYFYSPAERNINIHVDFPGGTVSQWYPERSNGELAPTGDTVMLNPEQNGSIEWKAMVLDPKTTVPLSHPEYVSDKWNDPRMTDANLVQNDKGEVEKFLFYRGLADFQMPLDVHWNSDGTVQITNATNWDIPFIYIYDYVTNAGAMGIWGYGPLAAGESKSFSRPDTFYYSTNIPETDSFRVALHTAGLTEKEASAMLATWSDGYFLSSGFKIFWIVPRPLTDKILPIKFDPMPDSLERVLVGKTEILTPAFETQLLVDYKNGTIDKWKYDRYYLAYIERAKQLMTAEVSSAPSTPFSIYPNPVSSTLFITPTSASGVEPQVVIRNVLGEIVLQTKGMSVDIHDLNSGIYFITVLQNTSVVTQKILKK